MLDIRELYWAAGFIEGEGTFSVHGSMKSAVSITVSQVQREPLARLYHHFGGKIQGPYVNGKHTPYFRWYLGGVNAVAFCMTLYTLMSRKRKDEIQRVLVGWKQGPGRNKWHKEMMVRREKDKGVIDSIWHLLEEE